jgi:hypothetical protein
VQVDVSTLALVFILTAPLPPLIEHVFSGSIVTIEFPAAFIPN